MLTPDNYYSQMSPIQGNGTGMAGTPVMNPLQMQFYTGGQMGYMPQAQFLTPAEYGAFRTLPTGTANLVPNQTPSVFYNLLVANQGNPFAGFGVSHPYLFNVYNPAVNQTVQMAQAVRGFHDQMAGLKATAGDFVLNSAVTAGLGMMFGGVPGIALGLMMPDLLSGYTDRIRQTRYIQQQTMSRIMSGPDVDRATGMGFSTLAARDIDRFIRRSAANDLTWNEGDYRRLLDLGLDAGMFDFLNSAQQYKTKLKQLRDTMTGVMDIVGSADFKDVLKQFKRMQDMGVSSGSFTRLLRAENTLARTAGLSHQDMLDTYGSQGSLIYTQNGLDAYTGSLRSMSNAAMLTTMQRSGMLSPAMLMRNGGMSGMTQRLTGENAKVESALKDWIALAVTTPDGSGFDSQKAAEVVNLINSGKFNIGALRNLGPQLTSENLASFMALKDENYSRFMNFMGQDPDGVQMLRMITSLGAQHNPNALKRDQFALGASLLGMNPESAKVMYQGIVFNDAGRAQRERQAVEEQRSRYNNYLRSHNMLGYIEQTTRSAMNSLGEFFMDDLLGAHFRKSDAEAAAKTGNLYTYTRENDLGVWGSGVDARYAPKPGEIGQVLVDEGGKTMAGSEWEALQEGRFSDLTPDMTDAMQRYVYAAEAGGRNDIFDESLYKAQKDKTGKVVSYTRGPAQLIGLNVKYSNKNGLFRQLQRMAQDQNDPLWESARKAYRFLSGGLEYDDDAGSRRKLTQDYADSKELRDLWMAAGKDPELRRVLEAAYHRTALTVGYRSAYSSLQRNLRGDAGESFDELMRRSIGNEILAEAANLGSGYATEIFSDFVRSNSAESIANMSDMEIARKLVGALAEKVQETHKGFGDNVGKNFYDRLMGAIHKERGNPELARENNRKYNDRRPDYFRDEARYYDIAISTSNKFEDVIDSLQGSGALSDDMIGWVSDINRKKYSPFVDLPKVTDVRRAADLGRILIDTMDTFDEGAFSRMLREKEGINSLSLFSKGGELTKLVNERDSFEYLTSENEEGIKEALKNDLKRATGRSVSSAYVDRIWNAYGNDMLRYLMRNNKAFYDDVYNKSAQYISEYDIKLSEELANKDEASRELLYRVNPLGRKLEGALDGNNVGNNIYAYFLTAIKNKATHNPKEYNADDIDAMARLLSVGNNVGARLNNEEFMKVVKDAPDLTMDELLSRLGLTDQIWKDTFSRAAEDIGDFTLKGSVSDAVSKAFDAMGAYNQSRKFQYDAQMGYLFNTASHMFKSYGFGFTSLDLRDGSARKRLHKWVNQNKDKLGNNATFQAIQKMVETLEPGSSLYRDYDIAASWYGNGNVRMFGAPATGYAGMVGLNDRELREYQKGVARNGLGGYDQVMSNDVTKLNVSTFNMAVQDFRVGAEAFRSAMGRNSSQTVNPGGGNPYR